MITTGDDSTVLETLDNYYLMVQSNLGALPALAQNNRPLQVMGLSDGQFKEIEGKSCPIDANKFEFLLVFQFSWYFWFFRGIVLEKHINMP